MRLLTSCSKDCQIPAPCRARQIQARPDQPWAWCSVFIPPPASWGIMPGSTFNLHLSSHYRADERYHTMSRYSFAGATVSSTSQQCPEKAWSSPDMLNGKSGGRHRRKMDARVPQRRVDPIAGCFLFRQTLNRPVCRHTSPCQRPCRHIHNPYLRIWDL